MSWDRRSARAGTRHLGKRLLDWLCAQAREESCDELHLNSEVQRYAAHRSYLRDAKMSITSHHFQVGLRDEDR